MAVIEFNRTSVAPVGLFGHMYANTVGALASWYDARATRNALERLSDRELDDIGLCRGDIERVVNRF